MTTVGQRIKNFRKNAGLSQADLAGKIGVTSQTVSKWECDVGLPDIIQIVPLADVLDVSTDAILGADANMDKNIEEALAEVEEKWKDGVDNQSPDRTEMHRTYDFFCAIRGLFRRYPTNYEITLQGVYQGSYLLRCAGRSPKDFPKIEGFSASSLLREVERMCRAIIAYDDNIERKIAAKERLVLAYNACGEEEKAKEELSGLPASEKNIARYRCCVDGTDHDERIRAAKDGFGDACGDFLYWLEQIANSYSAAGAAKRQETFAACDNLIAFCDRFTDFCDERTLLEVKRIGYLLKAQNHIRDGAYEDALDDIEALTSVVERFAELISDEYPDGSIYYDRSAEDDKWYSSGEAVKWFATALDWAISDFGDKTGNPVVTNDRYKACKARVAKLDL
ncbi:MAG: helix-turn-helix transcriptional regulator [Clostridia bacterium]|nr:helix-turn-helix transcriptional regulator [Clostridia bacterium]